MLHFQSDSKSKTFHVKMRLMNLRCGTHFRDQVLTQRQMATGSRGMETGLILQMLKLAIQDICGRSLGFRDLKHRR